MTTAALGEVSARILAPLPAGTQVRLSVRPEAWSITASAQPNAVRCRIDDVLYLGATSSITMSAGTQRLIVHRSNRQDGDTRFLQRGGEAWAGFHPEDAVVLPVN